MGNNESTPLPAAAAGDPCAAALEAYLQCVDIKTTQRGGLRDGDECEHEIAAYKECRQLHKKKVVAVAAAETRDVKQPLPR
ncbi:hypothetical protein H257_05164 [Aphanomyces astaci]|uniref:CHCH domain-containing protein n=1 Tax=Aphanomyces astaci TaxID=112090 RepID=W4GSB1_APHAT|nr:hypothetical protein H257_05164 [Aphanomyces astaci]ETV82567.1 hypothetical protein H257_05164 [Aphanomyces astaci]|eukprot:XP_009828236.1 hypothetical protein H257_05164 [Aphanomyces astaci]